METNRLRQFKVIVEAGGLLRASELLGLTGGGLSKSIKTLEAELGFRLFVQRGRGIELTAAGKTFYKRVPSILQTIDELLEFKESVTSENRPLKLVSFEVFTTHFLTKAICDYFGDRSIEVREAVPGKMEAHIAAGDSDIGLTYIPIPHSEIEFQKVGRIRMGIFGSKEKWAKMKVEDIPFVVPISPIEGSPSGVRGLDGWPEHMFSRNILYRVEMMETAIQLSRRGMAVSFLPEFVVKIANQQVTDKLKLTEIPLPEGIKPVSRDVYLIQRKGYRESKDVRLLAKAIRSLT